MIDTNTLSLFREKYKSLTADGRGDDFSDSTRVLTLGLVVGTDDPLEQGRLQIFCPALNDNPKKVQHLPWAAYITPFGGSINNNSYTRGTGEGTAVSDGAIHYGFWGVPELGAHVLVGCIDGDSRRRFWIGSLPEHQETHTQFNGRFDWSAKDGTPDGPLTSNKKPIQPIYDNWTKAFVDRKSREWKTRGADYQPSAVPTSNGGAPSKVRGTDYLDDTYEGMSKNEKDEWVASVMGAHGYDWSGFKNAGPFKSSRMFGFSSPGFHSISMDDRPFNLRTKIRSATGHMILLDDTNERIYLMTNKGNNWVEMDSNGNIDVYSERRVSIHCTDDLNLTSGATIRMHADKGIHMFAGHSVESGRGTLTSEPRHGEIRIQSDDDVNILGKNLRYKSIENSYSETGISRFDYVGDTSYFDVVKDINVRTIEGDYIKSIAKDLHETVMQDSKRLSYGKNAMASNGDSEIFSFMGNLAAGGQSGVSVKAANGDVNLEAQGLDSGTGNVNTNTPKAQTSIGDEGIKSLAQGVIAAVAGGTISQEINPTAAAAKDAPAGLMGATGAAGPSAIIMSLTGVTIKSPTDLKVKTLETYNSFNDITSKLNSVILEANLTGVYTSVLTTSVQALAQAVGKSFNIPGCSLNVDAMKAAIFSAVIPPEMLALYGDIHALNQRLQYLITVEGFTEEMLGVRLPMDVNDVVGMLRNNAVALLALHLPETLQFLLDPCQGVATMILDQLNLPINSEQVEPLDLPKFRPLVHEIFQNVIHGPAPVPPSPISIEPLPPAVTLIGPQ